MARGKTKSVANKVTNIKEKQEEKELKAKTEFNGTFIKIRIDKKTDVPEIIYTLNDEKNDKDIICKGKAEPLDSFLIAMQNLSQIFCEICEMENKVDECVITTVNFSQKGGVIISGQVNLTENDIPQPLCLNTPHILLENESGYELPAYAQEQLEELKRQAVLYIKGEAKNKQQTLFDEAAEG